MILLSDWSDGAAPVRPGEELNLERLAAFLAREHPSLAGELDATQFAQGYSNLTYLVTSADSAVLIINTIAAGGDAQQKPKIHIIVWGAALTLVIGTLLVAGGLGAINTAMIIGALPFSVVMALMGISLFKAVIRDGMRARRGGESTSPAE